MWSVIKCIEHSMLTGVKAAAFLLGVGKDRCSGVCRHVR